MTIAMRFAFLLAPLAFAACSLLPTPDPEPARNPQDPQFDADYYAQNAKEYFESDQFLRAREQWEQQLKLQPENWMAQVGIASCDFHVGSLALDAGNLRAADERMSVALKAAQGLWNGTIEPDAAKASNVPVAQWKAALCLALAHRGMADCATLAARIDQQRLNAIGPQDPNRMQLASSVQRMERTSADHRKQALDLFKRLDAMQNAAPEATLHVAELLVQTGAADEGAVTFRRWLKVTSSARTFWMEQLEKSNKEGDQRVRDARRVIIQQKLKAVAAKRAAVLVRLGNIAFDKGEALVKNSAPEGRAAAEREAKQHFNLAVDDLNAAMEAEPERLDVLVKLAQCQGRLGQYELAVNNLDRYIRTRSQNHDSWDENLNAAYRLKAEYDRRK